MSKRRSMESDTKTLIEKVLNEMFENAEKVNISQVARKANVSHSLIHSRYPDLAFKINQAKEKQKNKKAGIEASQCVEHLKVKVTHLKKSTADYKKVAESYQLQNEQLWEHIQQVYGMYDEILAERNGFAERLKFLK